MDRSMTVHLVGAIPSLPAARVVVPSLVEVLPVIPNPEPVVMLVALAAVVRILGTVMAPIPQG
jgi:hypothetical protein